MTNVPAVFLVLLTSFLFPSSISVQSFQTTATTINGPANPRLLHYRPRNSHPWLPTITATTTVLNAISSSSSSSSTSTTSSASAFDRCDVAIFGGGFGGLYTALALGREVAARNRRQRLVSNSSSGGGGIANGQQPNSNKKQQQPLRLDIALIDPSDNFVFLPLLYDLTMGTATEGGVCPTYKDLLEGTTIRHIRASFDGFVTNNNSNDDDVDQQQQQRQVRDADVDSGVKMALLSTKGGSNTNEEDTTTTTTTTTTLKLSFDACVMAVGATPQSILASVPGATQYAQPFYTSKDATATRDVLYRMDQKVKEGLNPNIAVVGGGYGGVELAACIVRRLPQSKVTLITRGPPMKGTRAEPLIQQALQRLGVVVEMSTVQRLTSWNDGITADERNGPNSDNNNIDKTKKTSSKLIRMDRIRVTENENGGNGSDVVDQQPWDVVFWTAGSSPSYPVPEKVGNLALTKSGRVQVDETLRCNWNGNYSTNQGNNNNNNRRPLVWSLGDCSEIVSMDGSSSGSSSSSSKAPAVPRTAQAAIQQADVVAANVLLTLDSNDRGGAGGNQIQKFQFLDLGTVLSLGGPIGAYLGPSDTSTLGPLVTPILDTARVGLNLVDQLFNDIIRSSSSTSSSTSTSKNKNTKMIDPNDENTINAVELATIVENLGLSLGGYGLGVDPNTAPGTLSGTLSGAARRAIYAVRMPTNKQRAYAVASAAISSAAALAKEAADQIQQQQQQQKDAR